MPLERPDLGVFGHVPQDNGRISRAWKQLSTHWDFLQTAYASRMSLKSSYRVFLAYLESVDSALAGSAHEDVAI